MYYTSAGTPIPIKWYNVSNRKAYININGSYLNTIYASYYSDAISAWPNASGRVSITNVSFSISNVDMATASEYYWNNRFGGYLECREYMGITDNKSTDGYVINSNNVQNCSKIVNYSNILLTPYTSDYDDSGHMKKVMVHEIGHVLGLGHPNTNYDVTNEASVMRQGTYDGYYTPRSHDINDLNNKY